MIAWFLILRHLNFCCVYYYRQHEECRCCKASTPGFRFLRRCYEVVTARFYQGNMVQGKNRDSVKTKWLGQLKQVFTGVIAVSLIICTIKNIRGLNIAFRTIKKIVFQMIFDCLGFVTITAPVFNQEIGCHTLKVKYQQYIFLMFFCRIGYQT